MRKIGSLILAVALLVPTGAALADPGNGAKQSTSTSSATVPAPKEDKLTNGFKNRAERLCDDLKVEYSLSFIPMTLCFYLLNEQEKAKAEEKAAQKQ